MGHAVLTDGLIVDARQMDTLRAAVLKPTSIHLEPELNTGNESLEKKNQLFIAGSLTGLVLLILQGVVPGPPPSLSLSRSHFSALSHVPVGLFLSFLYNAAPQNPDASFYMW